MRNLLIAALVGVGLALASPAYAISFDLTLDHCTGGCGTAPYGSVTLTQNGTTVDFTVDLADGIGWAKTGAADFMEFKFNGASSLASITVDQTFAGQTLVAQTGTLNGNGTGLFGFGIFCETCKNGNLGIISDISFHVANTTIAALTVPNAYGNIFVADIFSSATGNTGPVGTNVPEPASLLLLGAGLAGIGIWRRTVSKG